MVRKKCVTLRRAIRGQKVQKMASFAFASRGFVTPVPPVVLIMVVRDLVRCIQRSIVDVTQLTVTK